MLYIMRHGVTDWNKIHKLQGRTDIPLNEEGIQMARQAAELYKDVHFDVCFVSPLIRARQTAEILLEGRNVPLIVDERLVEMSFGICEGTYNYFDDPSTPVSNLFKDPENYKDIPEGAESFGELFDRTGKFIEDEVEPLLREGKDVLIVGHGAMNSSIICKINNTPLRDFWSEGIENCRLKKLL